MPNDEVCTVDGKRFKNRCEANCRGIVTPMNLILRITNYHS